MATSSSVAAASKRGGGLYWALLSVPVVTFGLGTWQIFRKQQKEELIATLEAKLSKEPAALPTNPADLAHMEYERVAVTGTFLHDQEMLVGPRTVTREVFSGMADLPEAGVQVITPFRLADTGEVILVNRGFVPEAQAPPHKRAAGQVEGTVRLEGIVRHGESQTAFVPDNHPEQNTWYWIDVFTMASNRSALPVLIDATAECTPPGGFPLGGQTNITVRNEHLSYIITWYSISAITLAMWVFLRRKGGNRSGLRAPPPRRT
ncbi:uncharacterized protein MONBRDRAFT_18583 [Monosiga brevicollis MX1]|uniref:SURF1-like protein n=1 Tax=Monosiga brevicollis TaxID=81824 RepID=SURF1_MONBE|nr:uncharacterized protein MONBRDRAFT_18583 [Monosiga brevicollis MX1]A9UWF0.1 RecName: Full=SURF1-like protein [Monosiga brevicollis]EDQ90553.1 predicted protein [Monosiga brevicollis MX1]|eukprot:XP_001744604.1 hypothetical protein [Monosiga brevicollis MX1]